MPISIIKLEVREWLVIYHSINSNVKLYELQNLLDREGIKTKIEMDDKPLANALKSYYSDKSDTVLKLLVPKKDFFKAKQLFNNVAFDSIGIIIEPGQKFQQNIPLNQLREGTDLSDTLKVEFEIEG